MSRRPRINICMYHCQEFMWRGCSSHTIFRWGEIPCQIVASFWAWWPWAPVVPRHKHWEKGDDLPPYTHREARWLVAHYTNMFQNKHNWNAISISVYVWKEAASLAHRENLHELTPLPAHPHSNVYILLQELNSKFFKIKKNWPLPSPSPAQVFFSACFNQQGIARGNVVWHSLCLPNISFGKFNHILCI